MGGSSSDTDTTIRNLERLEMVMSEWLSTQLMDSVLVRLHKVGGTIDCYFFSRIVYFWQLVIELTTEG